MATATATETRRRVPGTGGVRFSWTWFGMVPFFLFGAAFLLYPAWSILAQSVRSESGGLTLANFGKLNAPFIVASYVQTIQLSAVTALMGGLLGCLMAYAITVGGAGRFVRPFLLSFSGVASNFAGIPLAFAFIATLGNLGLVNWIIGHFGLNLRAMGFNLYSFWGLAITYTYFQIPLMVLVIVPVFDGLRREWQEASASLGASSLHYWRHVGFPIILPGVLGGMVLLFGNAFGAHATAFALTGGGPGTKVITILIGSQLSSDTSTNPGLANAMALGMIAIMGLTIALYIWLQRWSERWMAR
ncbi:MAG: ABC transporter permease subunit [Thermomicrobiales bacterium]